jgi:GNAT superfamily N-acetyltransferase
VGPERPRLIEAGDLPLADRFDCGTPALNEWLRVYAWSNHNSGSARVYVSIDTGASLIAGFYCLSAGAVELADVPKRVAKGLAHHPIPVVLIGRLGVDRRYANQGIGRFLIQDAFQHIIQTADIIGTRAVMVQAKNPEAAEFYRRLGFQASDTDPMLFFHLVKDVRKSLDAAGKH